MFSGPESAAGTWRDRALERSLEAPRARSVDRLERLVAAARDLANETGTAGFTVAQVAQRAGLSLKSFYRCFAGKDDLLVALLEEDSRLGSVILAEMVEQGNQSFLEQRQPVIHPCQPPTFRHRLIERIAGCSRAKQVTILGTEAADSIFVHQSFDRR